MAADTYNILFDSGIEKVLQGGSPTTLTHEITVSGNGNSDSSYGTYLKPVFKSGYELKNATGGGVLEDGIYNMQGGYYVTFTSKVSTSRISVDLTTLPGWANLSAGEKSITIVAKANGYKDSAPSAAVKVTKAAVMPAKGDIITLDSKQYRVLKTEGTVAEVLAMYNASSSVAFDSASVYNNTYAGKSLDTYCNSTFYSGLSAAMKNAIVDKTFTQDSWKRDTSVPTPSHYTGKYRSSTYYLTLGDADFGTSITRHCYVLSVQDVLDYLGATTSMGISDTTLTDTNILQMFWNQTTSPGSTYPWLRSAYASNSGYAFNVFGRYGHLDYTHVDAADAVRPAFQIDLSKISWS